MPVVQHTYTYQQILSNATGVEKRYQVHNITTQNGTVKTPQHFWTAVERVARKTTYPLFIFLVLRFFIITSPLFTFLSVLRYLLWCVVAHLGAETAQQAICVPDNCCPGLGVVVSHLLTRTHHQVPVFVRTSTRIFVWPFGVNTEEGGRSRTFRISITRRLQIQVLKYIQDIHLAA